MKNRTTNYKTVEFDRFMYKAGSNAFVLSLQRWIEATCHYSKI